MNFDEEDGERGVRGGHLNLVVDDLPSSASARRNYGQSHHRHGAFHRSSSRDRTRNHNRGHNNNNNNIENTNNRNSNNIVMSGEKIHLIANASTSTSSSSNRSLTDTATTLTSPIDIAPIDRDNVFFSRDRHIFDYGEDECLYEENLLYDSSSQRNPQELMGRTSDHMSECPLRSGGQKTDKDTRNIPPSPVLGSDDEGPDGSDNYRSYHIALLNSDTYEDSLKTISHTNGGIGLGTFSNGGGGKQFQFNSKKISPFDPIQSYKVIMEDESNLNVDRHTSKYGGRNGKMNDLGVDNARNGGDLRGKTGKTRPMNGHIANGHLQRNNISYEGKDSNGMIAEVEETLVDIIRSYEEESGADKKKSVNNLEGENVRNNVKKIATSEKMANGDISKGGGGSIRKKSVNSKSGGSGGGGSGGKGREGAKVGSLSHLEPPSPYKLRLKVSMTIMSALVLILSCSSLLFIFPIVVDPIVFGLQAQFSTQPAQCRTVNYRNETGPIECSEPSCREGCTVDLYSCYFITVEYQLGFYTDEPNPNSQYSNYNNNTNLLLAKNITRKYFTPTDNESKVGTLRVNPNGCGYPPEVTCSEFNRSYGEIDTIFPCYYSQFPIANDTIAVVPFYSRENEIIHLSIALFVPLGIVLFSSIILFIFVRWHPRAKRRKRTSVPIKKSPSDFDNVPDLPGSSSSSSNAIFQSTQTSEHHHNGAIPKANGQLGKTIGGLMGYDTMHLPQSVYGNHLPNVPANTYMNGKVK